MNAAPISGCEQRFRSQLRLFRVFAQDNGGAALHRTFTYRIVSRLRDALNMSG
jgi:hypothetical protein